MISLLTVLLVQLITAPSFAQFSPTFSGLNPKRSPESDYRVIASQYQAYNFSSPSGPTVYNSRKPLDQIDFDQIPQVDPQELKIFFDLIRESRELVDSSLRNRRLPWLFPDSGCFARAEFMAVKMEDLLARSPFKIFAFGNLVANSKYHPEGKIHWWYHVAPVVPSGSSVYVIDPSIDESSPLLLEEWIKKMHAKPEIAICRSHSYDPNSACNHQLNNQFERAKKDLSGFLNLEWDRVLELGLNPSQYL